jgi:hypothetical protein
VLAAFDITNQWSSARTQADAWDRYARTQEGVSWTMLRALMAEMTPTYEVAVASDPELASTMPGLTTLLGVKKTIAHKGVSTKKANAKAKAEGKQPTHGKVGKKATKAAAKAALAKEEAASQGAGASVDNAGQTGNGAVVAAAPAQVVNAQAGNVVSGVVNGAGGAGH